MFPLYEWLGTASFTQLILSYATHNDAIGVPTAAQWHALNTTVNGRLFHGTPFSRPCFHLANDTGGHFDPDECSAVMSGYRDHVPRSQIFGSYMNTQWETCQSTTSQCLLDSLAPSNPLAFNPPRTCSQGSISNSYIDVRTAADVVAGFKFSKKTGIPLVIKNTGHDFKGRSSAPNSLALWMHNFQSISLNRKFVPAGCPSSAVKPGVTLGAGINFNTLYEFADSHNITLPGGADSTVGAAGGYLQGGGHGALTNTVGLGVDRVLQFEVVTPSGHHVFANECQHSDLFFALRGGGGGTFGVVLGITTLVLPKMSFSAVRVEYNTNDDNRRQFLQFMTAHAIDYANQGWGGYMVPATGLFFMNPLLDEAHAKDSLASLKTLVTEKLKGNFTLTTQPSYLALYKTHILPLGVPVGLPFTVASRLIPVDNFRTDEGQAELVDAIIEGADASTFSFAFAVTPYLYGKGEGTSVPKAWRTSLWHVATADTWNYDASPSDRQHIYTTLSKSADPLRKITPGSGAYQNEADVYEPDFQASFWGDHYDRLLSIKKKYDPEHILDCWQCVGWQGPKNPRYQCYSQI